MNLKEFSEKDEKFKEACIMVGLPFEKHRHLGLGRQAGKWLRQEGLAYKEGRG